MCKRREWFMLFQLAVLFCLYSKNAEAIQITSRLLGDELGRLESSVVSMALSKDQKWLAAACKRRIKIVDAHTLIELDNFEHSERRHVHFLDNGTLLSTSMDGRLLAHTISQGKAKPKASTHVSERDFILSRSDRENQFFVSNGEDLVRDRFNVTEFALKQDQFVPTGREIRGIEADSWLPSSMDVAANGNWLCVALQMPDRPGGFAICDLRGNDRRTTYRVKSGDPDVELLKIHPNSTHVAAVGQRHLEIVRFDETFSHEAYDIGNGITQDMEFTKDGDELFVCRGSSILRFRWNGGHLLLSHKISGLPCSSCEIEISKDGNVFYVAGRNGIMQKFVRGPEGDFFAPRVVGHKKGVEKFAFDGANRYVATVSEGVEFPFRSSSVILWDTLMNCEEVFWIPEGEGFKVNSVKLSDDGGVLAVAYAGLISLWDIGQRKLVSQIQHEDASLSSPKVKHIEFESGSRKLMSFWSDGSVSVHLVDALCAPTNIGTFQNPNADVDMAPLISGNLLFIGNKVCSFPDTDDAELNAVPLKWSPLTNRDFKTNIISRALSDKHIAVATNSGQIYVWSKLDELGYSEARLLEADMRVPGIAFNSDGDLIGYRDHRIFVWNLTSGGRREFEIPKRSYEMSFLGFSKDGKKCVLRSMFGLVEILDLNFEG